MPRETGWALALLPSRGGVKGRGASDEFFDHTKVSHAQSPEPRRPPASPNNSAQGLSLFFEVV